MKTGVLLINLGTPKSAEPKDVATYLREFLMDPLVIDIPAVFRWILVWILVVPRRAVASSLLYRKVWTKRGSPLLFHTKDLAEKVSQSLGENYHVAMGMRYGEPSLEAAVLSLKAAQVKSIVVLPLYPQYSSAATESSLKKVKELMFRHLPQVPFVAIPPFYADANYLEAVCEVSKEPLAAVGADKVLFSFHGLPERQIKKVECLPGKCTFDRCCDRIDEGNRDCYRAQCYATSRELAKRLAIPSDKYLVAFQSRLGGTPWIKPYSDDFYRTLPGSGVRRIAVLSPSFVADCLETLEEIQIRGEEEFLRHGGEKLTLIPSVNSSDPWVKAVCQMVRNYQPSK